MTDEGYDRVLDELLRSIPDVNPLPTERTDEFFEQFGAQEQIEATHHVFFSLPHRWNDTLPHFWTEEELWECEPFYNEPWLRYDPREGF